MRHWKLLDIDAQRFNDPAIGKCCGVVKSFSNIAGSVTWAMGR